MRIVSLLPSATEIVCALGRQDQLVGISHSCDHPPAILDRPVLTRTGVPVEQSQQTIDDFVRDRLARGEGLYDLDIETLERLAPDVIISQTLCDICAVSGGDVYRAVAALSSRPELIELDASTLEDIYGDILRTAGVIDAVDEGETLVASLRQRADRVAGLAPLQGERVMFLEWLQPPFIGGHWIPDLIELLGGESVLVQSGERSGAVDWDAIHDSDPDRVLVACCGYSEAGSREALQILADDTRWQRLRAVQEGRVLIGDGNAHFSRAGPRVIDGLEWLATKGPRGSEKRKRGTVPVF
ncbi:MAG: cobalamin-binding protein [Pseudohongiellaceae bacterium]